MNWYYALDLQASGPKGATVELELVKTKPRLLNHKHSVTTDSEPPTTPSSLSAGQQFNLISRCFFATSKKLYNPRTFSKL